MGALNANLQVTAGQLPAGVCYDHDENSRLQAYAERLIVSLTAQYATFQYGDVAPTSDLGPWFNVAENEWWVWDDSIGTYRSMTLSSVTGQVPIGSVIAWAGLIGNISTFFNLQGAQWMHCAGAAISRITYATLFSIIDTQYGVGDGITTFNIPDLRDFMIAGAKTDSGGTAMSSIADPLSAALLKSRVYTQHKHRWYDLTPNEGVTTSAAGGDSAWTSTEKDTSSSGAASLGTDVRVLPPFVSMPFVIRIL